MTLPYLVTYRTSFCAQLAIHFACISGLHQPHESDYLFPYISHPLRRSSPEHGGRTTFQRVSTFLFSRRQRQFIFQFTQIDHTYRPSHHRLGCQQDGPRLCTITSGRGLMTGISHLPSRGLAAVAAVCIVHRSRYHRLW
jgi:hypothetical protein